MNVVVRCAVCLIVVGSLTPVMSHAQTLEAESALQIPRAVITDSAVPFNVVGQAFFASATSVQVALKYGSCPVVLTFQNGELLSTNASYFNASNCTGTPYFRVTTLNPSPHGTACGYFLINLNRELFRVFSAASKISVTFNSRLTNGVCEAWGPEVWMAYATQTPKIGDLDNLFTPPFKLEQ